MSLDRAAYPSDVNDEEWALVAPYLALLREDSKQRDHDLREVFNGLRFIVKTGAPWRFLPHDLPPWAAVYQQVQRWLAAECFTDVAGDLRAVLRMAGDREPEPSAVVLDSRTLRSSPESGERAGYDGAKRKRGSKVHLAVDTPGHMVALHVTPADADDRGEVGRLTQAVQAETEGSVELGFVDQGYTGHKAVAAAQAHGIALGWCGCLRSSVASCCCLGVGLSSDPSPGPPAADGSSRITSATPARSQVSILSRSSASC